MLARGSEPALRTLAEQELAVPTDASAQAALGDAWARQADKETALYKARARARASEWLARATPRLSGLAKMAAEKKLASLIPASASRDCLALDLGDGVKMEFVVVKPGSFVMGGTRPGDDEGRADERPEHKVTLTKGFSMGKYHVTRGQFAVFVKATGYKTDAETRGASDGRTANGGWSRIPGMTWRNPNFPQTDEHPVTCVSWNDAKAFCDWLLKKTGRGVRLPTEAEWEHACRAGNRTSWFFGEQESMFGDYAWFGENSGYQTHPVGQKKANPWASTTCTATCGRGARTGWARTPPRMRWTPRGRPPASTASFAEEAGSAARTATGTRSAMSGSPPTPARPTGSGSWSSNPGARRRPPGPVPGSGSLPEYPAGAGE
jgi:formylglycine-generating enzyme required for sulfatase activity